MILNMVVTLATRATLQAPSYFSLTGGDIELFPIQPVAKSLVLMSHKTQEPVSFQHFAPTSYKDTPFPVIQI